jgi:hypothetical protein
MGTNKEARKPRNWLLRILLSSWFPYSTPCAIRLNTYDGLNIHAHDIPALLSMIRRGGKKIMGKSISILRPENYHNDSETRPYPFRD